MDMTVNLFTAQNEQLSQLPDISVNNRSKEFGTCFEDTVKLKIDAGEELPLAGNEMPVQSIVLFENALKEKIVNISLDETLSENTIFVNNLSVNDNQKEIEEEVRYVLSNDFLNMDKQPLYLQEHQLYQFAKHSENAVDEVLKNNEMDSELVLVNNTPFKNDIMKLISNEQSSSQLVDKLFLPEDEIKDLVYKNSDLILMDEQGEKILSNEEITPQVIDIKTTHSESLNDAAALLNAKIDKIAQTNFSSQSSENDKIESNKALMDDPIFNPQLGVTQTDNAKKDLWIQAKFGNEEHVSSKHFEQELSNQVQIMVNASENSAKVNIDPPELGQIEIKIVQDADKTHIMFFANLEQTHDLIESGLLRLRAQMEAQGLQLGNVSVSYNGTESNQSHTAKQHFSHQPLFSTKAVENNQHSPIIMTNNGLLDLYV
jgi:flagellar hook-length control protein FliK